MTLDPITEIILENAWEYIAEYVYGSRTDNLISTFLPYKDLWNRGPNNTQMFSFNRAITSILIRHCNEIIGRRNPGIPRHNLWWELEAETKDIILRDFVPKHGIIIQYDSACNANFNTTEEYYENAIHESVSIWGKVPSAIRINLNQVLYVKSWRNAGDRPYIRLNQ